jgi:hypothetical protein
VRIFIVGKAARGRAGGAIAVTTIIIKAHRVTGELR